VLGCLASDYIAIGKHLFNKMALDKLLRKDIRDAEYHGLPDTRTQNSYSSAPYGVPCSRLHFYPSTTTKGASRRNFSEKMMEDKIQQPSGKE